MKTWIRFAATLTLAVVAALALSQLLHPGNAIRAAAGTLPWLFGAAAGIGAAAWFPASRRTAPEWAPLRRNALTAAAAGCLAIFAIISAILVALLVVSTLLHAPVPWRNVIALLCLATPFKVATTMIGWKGMGLEPLRAMAATALAWAVIVTVLLLGTPVASIIAIAGAWLTLRLTAGK